MKVLVVFALTCLALVAASRNFVLDYLHEYRFEEHDKRNHKLLIAISDSRGMKKCHIIEVNTKLAHILKRRESMKKATEEIYELITSGKADEKKLKGKTLFSKYKDHALVKECRHHTTFSMNYTPKFKSHHNKGSTHKPMRVTPKPPRNHANNHGHKHVHKHKNNNH